MNTFHSDPSHDPETDAAPADAASAPGYFPRLLSAAAHVSHLASDSVLERFKLNQARFAVLNRLAVSCAAETALSEATGQAPGSLHPELDALQSSGYVRSDAAGQWAITDAGLQVIECARLAQAEVTLDAEDSQELRRALRSLIASLGLEAPDAGPRPQDS